MAAVQRLSLADIATRILEVYGVAASANAFWASDANLYKYINLAGQNIPAKVASIVAPDDPSAVVAIDFWRTKVDSATSGASLVIAASSSTGYLPVDYYQYESFYDLTNKAPIFVVQNPARRQKHIDLLKRKPAGPPEAVEILDMTTNGSNWQRQFAIYPSTFSGVTPSVQLVYYRVPASMPGSSAATEYPDAPVEFHPLWLYGTLVELMARSDPNFDRYKAMQDELLNALARQAKVIR